MFSDKIKTKNANINGKVFAIYEKRAAAHRRESSPGASPLMLWSKIRLERKWVAAMRPIFAYMSIG